jgi:hypothetical protein
MPSDKLHWYYGTKVVKTIEDLPNYEHLVGFIYVIRDRVTGRFYIGKKALYHSRKTKISQRTRKATGTRKTYQRVVKESDWKTYYGSCKELISDVQKYGEKRFERQILELCCSKKYLSYAEIAWQIKLDVLKEHSYNGNILGRYYARDMENCTT